MYSLFHPQAAVDFKSVTPDPLDIVGILSAAHHPKAGAVVLFSGEVRNHNHGREVRYLEYEAYQEMAEAMISDIVMEAGSRFHLHKAICVHRIGKVEISESAVVVVTCSSHRKEAYEANQYIIDRVKHEVPIWKKEVFSDGTHKWGNNCSCH